MDRLEITVTVAAVLDQWFDADSLGELRRRVLGYAQAAGLSGGRAAEVVLALHELAANVIRHGAGSGRLQIQVVAGALRCRVADAGRPCLDGQSRPATHWPVRRGHGLWLVRQAADHLDMSSGPGGSEVTVVFAFP